MTHEDSDPFITDQRLPSTPIRFLANANDTFVGTIPALLPTGSTVVAGTLTAYWAKHGQSPEFIRLRTSSGDVMGYAPENQEGLPELVTYSIPDSVLASIPASGGLSFVLDAGGFHPNAVGAIALSTDFLALGLTVVPEPTTSTLFTVGALLGLAQRRRNAT